MKTHNISKADKEEALGLLREAAQAGEDSDLLKPRVEELKKYYKANEGDGKEFAKLVTARKKELEHEIA